MEKSRIGLIDGEKKEGLKSGRSRLFMDSRLERKGRRLVLAMTFPFGRRCATFCDRVECGMLYSLMSCTLLRNSCSPLSYRRGPVPESDHGILYWSGEPPVMLYCCCRATVERGSLQKRVHVKETGKSKRLRTTCCNRNWMQYDLFKLHAAPR